ncbi:MAG: aromatic ring-hydroxylating dioxygenase subunit alpha [Anaerolineales bacterium]
MSQFLTNEQAYVYGAKTLPQVTVTSADVFAQEQERIFKRLWMCVGHVSRIPEPGDYFLQEMFGESLIILRDREQTIRAFYNVCRHRGARICEAEALNAEGNGKFRGSIQCAYHAWTYGLDGKLIGAPFMKNVPDFPWDDFPLRAAPVQIWEGFIFVNLSMESPLPFGEIFDPLAGRFDMWNMPSLKSEKRIAYDIAANWKLIFQNFHECYHCPTIHPQLNRLTDYTGAAHDFNEGPVLGGLMELTGGESMTASGQLCAIPLGNLPPEEMRRGYYYSIMPNLLLNIHPDYLMYHILFPEAPNRTRLVSEWLFHPQAAQHPGYHPQDAIDFWHETNLQDWHVCELTQQGMQSQSYTPGWYSPRESLPAAFDRDYMRWMGG